MVWLPPLGGQLSDSGMGHFHVTVQVGAPAGDRFVPIEALVDTGSTYTWIPRDALEGLGVAPQEAWPFVLAEPILGVFALEGFRLAADPVNHRLISVPGRLKAAPRLQDVPWLS